MADNNADEPVINIDIFQAHEDHICEFGDIILVAAANDGYYPTTKLRVSSCILAMSSKVFKVMFGSHFAEGRNLRAGVREIRVEDEPLPLKRLCLLLHHQSPYLPDEDEISTSAMLDLAIIADMYDCTESLRLSTDSLLKKYTRDAWGGWNHQLDHLVTIAYKLDQPPHFRQFCREMVMREIMLNHKSFNEQCRRLLPEALIPSLVQQQIVAKQELGRQLSKFTLMITDAAERCGMINVVGDLQEAFSVQNSGLCPLDFRNRTLYSMIQAFEQVQIPFVRQADNLRKHYEPRHWNKDGWSGWPLDENDYEPKTLVNSDAALVERHRRSLRTAAWRVYRVCAGVCLDCLGGHECRHPYEHPWQNSRDETRDGAATDSWKLERSVDHPDY